MKSNTVDENEVFKSKSEHWLRHIYFHIILQYILTTHYGMSSLV